MHTSDWEGMACNEQETDLDRQLTRIVMHHNGDYSGNVKFVLPARVANSQIRPIGSGPSKGELIEVNIPMDAIRFMFISYLKNRKAEELETMSSEEFEDHLLRNM